ncbi:hypothetical protein [Kaistia sp. MMO-174]|uniref:hypothetical protein n=1 Tax=Kaistia sp. MMO-174 TaxID=3081256 RepID=UPI00301775A6
MALGISAGGGSGEIKPFIKYDARAGRMFRIDRSQNSSGQYESNEVDISQDCTFVADLANIRVGWVNYSPQGPVKRMVVLGQAAIPARPEDKGSDGKPLFKQGFEFTVLLHKNMGGGPAREFGSSAGCVIEAIDALHDAYMAAPEAAQGKVPIVKMVKTSAVKSGQSTNYKPTFEIIGWTERSDALPPAPSASVGSNASAASSTPPTTGSTHAAPPAAAPAPQPAAAGADDFG